MSERKKTFIQFILWPLVVMLLAGVIGRYVALSAAQYVTKTEAESLYLKKEDAELKYLTSLEYRDMFLKVGEMSGDISYIKLTMEDLKDYLLHDPPLNH